MEQESIQTFEQTESAEVSSQPQDPSPEQQAALLENEKELPASASPLTLSSDSDDSEAGDIPSGNIPNKVYFRIGDVAEIVGVKAYVLRYWETEFAMIHPTKSSSGQRVYRRSDVETLLLIKHLLYTQRYSIEGARKKVRDLRKTGELDTFKKEIFVGPEVKVQREQRLKELKLLSTQLHEAVHKPLHHFFQL